MRRIAMRVHCMVYVLPCLVHWFSRFSTMTVILCSVWCSSVGAVWVVCWPDSLQRGHSPVSFTLRAKARCCRCLCLCLCFAFVSLGCDSNVQRWCMLAWLLHVQPLNRCVCARACLRTHTPCHVLWCGCAQSLWSKMAQGKASRGSASAIRVWFNNDVAQYCSFDSLALLPAPTTTHPRTHLYTPNTHLHTLDIHACRTHSLTCSSTHA